MSRGFDDVLEANERYAETFRLQGLTAPAALGLCVLTCMDSRIEPLTMLGLKPGDAKILRNAGGRVTDDVIATMVVARHLLNVDRLMVVQHTNCRMGGGTAEELHEAIRDAGGPDTSGIPYAVASDQEEALRGDVELVRQSPLLPGFEVGGFIYDVETGRVSHVV